MGNQVALRVAQTVRLGIEKRGLETKPGEVVLKVPKLLQMCEKIWTVPLLQRFSSLLTPHIIGFNN